MTFITIIEIIRKLSFWRHFMTTQLQTKNKKAEQSQR